MNTQSSEGFVWNDNLVKQFVSYYILSGNTSARDIDLNTFKDYFSPYQNPPHINTYTSKDNLVSGSNVAMGGKDWEIVSYKNNDLTWNLYQGKYYNVFSGYTESVPQNASIYSVRRVSDMTIWTVKDETTYGTIESFFIEKNVMNVHFTNGCGATLASIEKNTKPEALFVTEDGKVIFDGDDYWHVLEDWSIKNFGTDKNWVNYNSSGKRDFSTELAAHQYVSENKPSFSIKDFKDILKRYDYAIDMMEDVFSDLKYLGKLNDKNG